MRKPFTAICLALFMAGCAGAPAVILSIFDQVNAAAKQICGYTFVFQTIDQMIKALGGQPIAETIASLLCTQARSLAAQNIAPKVAASSEGPASILGTVIINGRPVTIAVQR